MASFEPRRCFEHIDKLSYEIGPRLAGTERSNRASQYIKEQFEEYDLKTRFQNFEFVDRARIRKITAVILAGVFVVAPFLGAKIAIALILSGYATHFAAPHLMPKQRDRNVVGTLKPKGEVERRVVVGAHYDTARCVRGWKWVVFYQITLPAVLAALLALSVLRFFMGSSVWWISWSALAPLYLLTCLTPLWVHENLVSPGADDNASGVSVLLELARTATESPPENTEIQFVALGGEEQNLAGGREFARRTSAPDFLLNLDSLGGGDRLALIQGNGILRKIRSSPELNERIRERSEVDMVWSPLSDHDHIPFIKRGIKATTLSSYESKRKNRLDNLLEKFLSLPNVRTKRHSQLHTIDDVPEGIRLENIKKAGEVSSGLLGLEGK